MTMTKDEMLTNLIDYESGELGENATIDFFQHLVDTGMAWRLQGHYGRTASVLIEAGYITEPTN
jgi:hypothetical protein